MGGKALDAQGNKIDDQAEWNARINHMGANLHNVVLTDHLTEGTGNETYIPGSFRLRPVTFDATGVVITAGENIDLTDKLTIAPDRKSFELNLGDIGVQQYRLTYRTTYVPGTTLRNNLTLTSVEQSKTVTSSHIGASSGGSGSGVPANKIKIVKVDAEDQTVKLANATFKAVMLDAQGNPVAGAEFELTTGSDGTVTSGTLTSGTYKVWETAAPSGYVLDDQTSYTLTVNSAAGALQTVKNEPERTSVNVTKTWVGPKGDSVTVKLLADGTDTGKTVTLNEGNGWKGSFDNLRKYKAGTTTAIVYKVTEAEVSGVDSSKYDTVVTGDAASGFTITNTNKETVGISGTKTWDDGDDRDGVRPASITVNLLADGTTVQTKTVTEADGWAYDFGELAKYAADGHEIVYTVTEDAVANYSTTVNGFDVKNSYAPGKTSVTVTKTWNDGNDKDGLRPASVKVQLYANGKPAGDPVTLDAAGKWTHTWTDLFLKEGGKDIAYTIKEVDVPKGYEAKVTGDAQKGFTIENSHEPSKEKPPAKTGKMMGAKTPKTGDDMSLLALTGLAATGIVALGVAFAVRKKRG